MALSPANSIGAGYPLALTGAVAPTRFVGGTTTGAPVAGTFEVGDFVVAQDGALFICTAAGSPGTWAQVSGGSSGYTNVVKAADESRASNTTPADDSELLFTVAAGSVYEITGVIVYASPAGAGTPDMKFTFHEDATARGELTTTGLNATDAASGGNVLTNGSAALTFGTAATDRAVRFTGWHVGGGGTLSFQWSQGTSNVNPTIVRAGSVVSYRVVV